MQEIAKKSRRPWLDICKGFAIILVVAGHVVTSYHNSRLLEDAFWFNYVGELIYLFHMPLFFVVSGYLASLSSNKKLRVQIANKLWAYGVPYLAFSVLALALKFAAAGVVNNKATWEDLYLIPLFPMNALWFLYALLIISVVQLCVDRIVKRKAHKAFWLCFTFALGWIGAILAKNEKIYGSGWNECVIFDVFRNGFWYVLGGYASGLIRAMEERVSGVWERKTQRRYTASVALFLAIIGFMILPLGWEQAGYGGWTFALAAAPAAIGVLLSLLGSIYIYRSGLRFALLLEYLGKRTLPIYLLHGYAISALRVIFSKWEIPLFGGVTPLICGTVFALAVSLVLYASVKRFYLIDFCFYPTKYRRKA